jgi:hypothetical protein
VTRPSQPQPGAVNGEAIPHYDSGSSWCMVGVRLVLVLRIYFSASDPKRRKGVNTQRGNSTLPVPLPVRLDLSSARLSLRRAIPNWTVATPLEGHATVQRHPQQQSAAHCPSHTASHGADGFSNPRRCGTGR